MSSIRLFASVIALVVFVAAPAGAASLSSDNVSRWITSMADVAAWGDANKHRFEKNPMELEAPVINPMGPPVSDADMERMRQPFSNAVQAARVEGIDGELASLVGPHGFGLDDWGDVGDLVIRAYFAIKMEDMGDMKSQLNESINQMEAMGQTQFASSMMRTLDVLNAMSDAPAEDIATVRPHASKLEQNFGQ